ncbi:MAG: DNA polymerase III subunit gamma/tau, partial [Chloroflexota bacterium]
MKKVIEKVQENYKEFTKELKADQARQHDELKARPDDSCDYCLAVNNNSFLDLIEIDAASNTSVEDVRSLRDKINFSPNQGRYKVYIIDEVHMLSTAAFNALLKTLEEPPAHAIFVLATTEVHKIPATVLSRCQQHEFRRISVIDIVNHLEKMAAEEKINITKPVLQLIARQAAGGLRDAISLLDQLSALGEEVTLEKAQAILGTATTQVVLALIDAIQEGETGKGLDAIHTALDKGSDPRQFTRQIVDYLRAVLLVRMGNADQVDAAADERAHMAQHAQSFDQAQLLRIIRIFNTAVTEGRGAWLPSLPLELALVEAIEDPLPASENQETPSTPIKGKVKKTPPSAKAGNQSKKSAPLENEMSREDWQKILTIVREKSPNTTGLLNSSKTREYRNDTIYLGFSSEVLREKMSQAEHLEIVHQAAEKTLGSKTEIVCILTEADGSMPAGVDSSGMVATAVRL